MCLQQKGLKTSLFCKEHFTCGIEKGKKLSKKFFAGGGGHTCKLHLPAC